MSLKEKYNEALQNRESDSRPGSDESEIVELCEECGLDSSRNYSPLKLTKAAQTMINEAVELIEVDKWHQAKTSFSKKDLHYESFNMGMSGEERISLLDDVAFVYQTGVRHSSYVKYRVHGGKVLCGTLRDHTRLIGTTLLGLKAKLEPGRFISETNKMRAHLNHFLYGDQKYVILYYLYHEAGDWSPSHHDFILFRDGYLFFTGDMTADIFGALFGEGKQSLEDWLIENIKRINGH